MAQPQGESSTVKKEKAWWSHEEEVLFLDYLINYWSEVTWGSFKSSTMMVAINSISHLHVEGMVKNKTSRIKKWSLVSS